MITQVCSQSQSQSQSLELELERPEAEPAGPPQPALGTPSRWERAAPVPRGPRATRGHPLHDGSAPAGWPHRDFTPDAGRAPAPAPALPLPELHRPPSPPAAHLAPGGTSASQYSSSVGIPSMSTTQRRVRAARPLGAAAMATCEGLHWVMQAASRPWQPARGGPALAQRVTFASPNAQPGRAGRALGTYDGCNAAAQFARPARGWRASLFDGGPSVEGPPREGLLIL